MIPAGIPGHGHYDDVVAPAATVPLTSLTFVTPYIVKEAEHSTPSQTYLFVGSYYWYSPTGHPAVTWDADTRTLKLHNYTSGAASAAVATLRITRTPTSGYGYQENVHIGWKSIPYGDDNSMFVIDNATYVDASDVSLEDSFSVTYFNDTLSSGRARCLVSGVTANSSHMVDHLDV